MPEHLKEAGYPGQIEIDGTRSPITYKLNASKDNDGAYHVAVSLTAPRDWLLTGSANKHESDSSRRSDLRCKHCRSGR